MTTSPCAVDVERPSEPSQFDYEALEPAVANFLQGQADRIHRSTGTCIINIGKALIEAKHYLNHGLFVDWVEHAVGMPIRTAQAYMKVGHWAKGKSATVALLPPSLLYILSAPSTPPDFVMTVLTRVEAGERVDIDATREELKSWRDIDHHPTQLAGGKRHNADVSRRQLRGSVDDRQPDDSENRLLVMEAVSIMAAGLSKEDFVRVRQAMTSQSVVGDSALGMKIAVAFATVSMVSVNNGDFRTSKLLGV